MSEAGKKLYEERAKDRKRTAGAYMLWERLPDSVKKHWNDRAKTNAASKKANANQKFKGNKDKPRAKSKDKK